MREGEKSIQEQARTAGLLYLAIALISPIGLMYVPGKLIVSGNATATADNIRASEGLLRIGIASELIHQAVAVFLVLALSSHRIGSGWHQTDDHFPLVPSFSEEGGRPGSGSRTSSSPSPGMTKS